jgi:hypothetical protein
MNNYIFRSQWELLDNTNNTWRSLNCVNGRAEVVKHMGCWMLEILYDSGKYHVSSHNTRPEAIHQAECKAVWSVDFGNTA